MKKAKWFSRHQPTPEQIADAARMGYEIAGVSEGMELGARALLHQTDVWEIAGKIAPGGTDVVLFGVFPTPLRGYWFSNHQTERAVSAFAEITLFEAWNVQRTAEGGKPTFEHLRWCRTT